MKKIIILLAAVFMLQACDDGDITLESFNFDSVTAKKCPTNNLVYKINGNELLLISIPETFFANEVTIDGSPRIVNVNADNRIVYRLYSDNVSEQTICSILPPASPTVQKEWNATGGTIEIITNAIFAADEITITGYTHNIKFLNVNFSNPENSFSFTEYIFGNYEKLL
ncbi:hypothetical protein ACFSX9_11900 [Flavobacterium ardleyense]|uniref:Lipoprotein n=1 Tax=Flavobacterium ardleyense TaxID=2038737 RepID=A0ABW5Z9U4_9FLAO